MIVGFWTLHSLSIHLMCLIGVSDESQGGLNLRSNGVTGEVYFSCWIFVACHSSLSSCSVLLLFTVISPDTLSPAPLWWFGGLFSPCFPTPVSSPPGSHRIYTYCSWMWLSSENCFQLLGHSASAPLAGVQM